MPNPRGRQTIGVNQPPSSGSLYPFVQPSPDIQELIGDFFVSFDDLADDIVYPLRVAWLYGFGTTVVPAPPGWPTPAHSHDLVVVDANDVVVFDSTQAERFTSSVWDNRLLILEWTNDDRVCRCTKYTQWTAADIASGQTKTYDQYIEPTNGELQADCYYKLPKRVTSLQVGLTSISKTAVTFAEGYNMGITRLTEEIFPEFDFLPLVNTQQVRPGRRLNNRIQLDATPGLGLGVFPGCVGEETYLRTINKVRSNTYQNFNYDTDGCIRNQRPVGITNLSPREVTYASFELPSAESRAAIRLSNDCVNCCECTYFAQTYQGLKRQWFLYKDVAELAEETRDTYSSNRDRWLIQKQIRETETLRGRLVIDGDGKFRWGIGYCNARSCLAVDGYFYVAFLVFINGIYMPSEEILDCEPAYVDGPRECNGPTPILPVPPPNPFFWGYNVRTYGVYPLASGDNITINGRICIPAAKTLPPGSVKVRLWAASRFDTIPCPPTAPPCAVQWISPIFADAETMLDLAEYPEPIEIDSEYVSEFTVIDGDNPYCKRCECGDLEP